MMRCVLATIFLFICPPCCVRSSLDSLAFLTLLAPSLGLVKERKKEEEA